MNRQEKKRETKRRERRNKYRKRHEKTCIVLQLNKTHEEIEKKNK
jgi:hypothetical protein